VRRIGAVAALTLVGTVLTGGIAAAHVTVNPATAAAGSYAILTFRVPNESATASTTGLTVQFPTDHPLASVRTKPVPGWTAELTRSTLPTPVTEGAITIKEAVTSVTWTADAASAIGPDQFQEFAVSVGPVPDVDALRFPADQQYSDGTTVAWDQVQEPGQEEPEHPAPTLTVTPATEEDAGAGTTTSAASSTGDPTGASGPAAGSSATSATSAAVAPVAAGAAGAAAPDTDDSVARTLGIVGIVVAAVAIALGAIGLLRPRRQGPSA
jgi:uncharacterized protein YcnI